MRPHNTTWIDIILKVKGLTFSKGCRWALASSCILSFSLCRRAPRIERSASSSTLASAKVKLPSSNRPEKPGRELTCNISAGIRMGTGTGFLVPFVFFSSWWRNRPSQASNSKRGRESDRERQRKGGRVETEIRERHVVKQAAYGVPSTRIVA